MRLAGRYIKLSFQVEKTKFKQFIRSIHVDMKIAILRNLALFLLLSLTGSAYGTIRLPKLISDGMILQRETKVKIWGWGSPSEKITVEIAGQQLICEANGAGEWFVLLSPQKAGGPYSMDIKGENAIKINNILFGDVWLCSGQSNMELPMYRVKPRYEEAIKNSENTNIRYFLVPKKYDFKSESNDLDYGNWQEANPEKVLNFSAAAYFFALELNKKYNVAIGLINSSLGGSPVEAWMSEEALKTFPNQLNEAYKFRDDDLIKQIELADKARSKAWYNESSDKDEGLRNAYRLPGTDDSGWMAMNVPGYWANTSLGEVNGVVWFRKKFRVSPEDTGKPAFLNLGRIVDADSVFINGKYTGSVSYQYPPRWYNVPQGILVAGENTIVARVVNNSGKGGFVPDKPYELKVAGKVIDLKGEWKMKLGCTMPPLAGETFIRWKPMGLYNAMIAPLKSYTIMGAIWYQGESNTGNPTAYGQMFPAMIQDWRKHFAQGEFPFLFVQLANFMEAKDIPSESNWAKTRESQLKTLTVPKTGMAVIIDIGEWNDIHPLNKQDVGKRLALAAQKLAYHDSKVVYSGPLYESMKVKGNKIELSFTQTGSGLFAKDQKELKQFAIAGADKKFVWAKAEIKNNKVVVWSNEIRSPVAVRYAWADNPEGANLYNREGLPASPFRTDSW